MRTSEHKISESKFRRGIDLSTGRRYRTKMVVYKTKVGKYFTSETRHELIKGE